jgi:hypothetical protein
VSVVYNGHYTLIYGDHIDTATGKTLVAVPGNSYNTTVAPGRHAGVPATPGDGRWGTGYVSEKAPKKKDKDAGKTADEATTADKEE